MQYQKIDYMAPIKGGVLTIALLVLSKDISHIHE